MAEYQARVKRFAGFATIFVMDEYNNTLEAARMHDRLSGSKQKKEDLISALTYERITKGRSKLVCDWITTHEPDVRAIKLSLSLQQSLNFIVLARGNKFGAIHAALSGRRAIVDDDLIREQLYQQFTQYRQDNSTDFNVVVALTNLLGDWRLVMLPRYPDQQPAIQPMSVSTDRQPSHPQHNQPSPSPGDFRSQVVNYLSDCWQAETSDNSGSSAQDKIDALPDITLRNLAAYLQKQR